MIIGIPKETFPDEKRVALTPESLAAVDAEIVLGKGAGEGAGFPDQAYQDRGAQLAERAHVFARADTVLQVRTLGANPEAGAADLELMRQGQVFVGTAEPLVALEALKTLAGKG